ncbi:hypothetical protein DSO57_1039452 [Entomophthora muscae]|nr:hypothetical protein DSO57_1039452 [Entomophthora muscae]
MSESYGGHFVPEIASLLHSQRSPVNLTSIAIASPFIDAQIQFPTIQKVLCPSTCPQLEKSAHHCSQTILNCKSPLSCKQAFEVCDLKLIKPYMDSGNDLYSTDPSHRATQTMIDLSTEIDSILNSPLIQRALNITIPFQTYNPAIFANFIASGDLMTSSSPKLQQYLERGHRVLLYSGGKDLLNNIQGIEEIAKSIVPDWPRSFSHQTRLTKTKVHRNLQVTAFPSAGHWISTYHPSQVYKLVNHWVRS